MGGAQRVRFRRAQRRAVEAALQMNPTLQRRARHDDEGATVRGTTDWMDAANA